MPSATPSDYDDGCPGEVLRPLAERLERDAEDLLALGVHAEGGRHLLEADDGRDAQGEALDHWDGDVADEAPRAEPREADEDQSSEDARRRARRSLHGSR